MIYEKDVCPVCGTKAEPYMRKRYITVKDLGNGASVAREDPSGKFIHDERAHLNRCGNCSVGFYQDPAN